VLQDDETIPATSCREPASKTLILEEVWGRTLQRPELQPVRIAGPGLACLLAAAKFGISLRGWFAVALPILARGILLSLKLLWGIADNPIVQKSALIYGLLLALSAATLAGIGEWASGGFDSSTGGYDSSTVAPDSSSFLASPGEYGSNHVAAIPPLPAVLAPAVSNVALSTTPGYTIRRTVPEVRLQFTVADERGRPIQNLSQDDIRIFDDDSPVAKLQDFARDENLPLRLGILLDVSDSIKRVLPEEKAAALEFLGRVLRPESDRAFVMSFAGNVQLWQGVTNDRDRLIQAVNRLHQPGWGTVVYDAMFVACVDHLSRSDDGALVHRAIVVLTDGADTNSLHTLADVIAAAQRSEIQIYALTVHKKGLRPQGDVILQRLADETGGGLFVAPSAKEMQGAFAEIELQMRTQYYVSFTPQSTPGFHALQVEVRAPQNAQVRARRGYFAIAQ
jgi:VWFA-related protein